MDLKLYCVFSKMLSNSSKLGMKKIHFTKYWDHSKFFFRFQDIWVFKLFGKKTFFLKIRNKWWFFSNFLYFRKNKVHIGISTRKKNVWMCFLLYVIFCFFRKIWKQHLVWWENQFWKQCEISVKRWNSRYIGRFQTKKK